jgi:hypothetical protein
LTKEIAKPALTLLVLALLALPFLSVQALAAGEDREPLPENLAGLDGVGLRCIVSTDRAFVQKMCELLIAAGIEKAANKGLKTANAGITWERNTDDAYRAAIDAAKINRPLLLEIFIRGTDGEPVSGSIHILASVEYVAAIEQNGESEPRSGRLLVWESAGTASGPAKQLPDALAAHMSKKLDLLFAAFRK